MAPAFLQQVSQTVQFELQAQPSLRETPLESHSESESEDEVENFNFINKADDSDYYSDDEETYEKVLEYAKEC